MFDYGTMIKCVMRNRDIKGALPWYGWDKLPLTSVFTVRGCSINCAECGGSHYANGKVVCRKKPAFRSPEKLAEDIDIVQSYLNTPVFIVGDLRQQSMGYAERFLKECRDRRIKNHVVIELFNGASPEYFKDIDRSFEGGWSIEFSPTPMTRRSGWPSGRDTPTRPSRRPSPRRSRTDAPGSTCST